MKNTFKSLIAATLLVGFASSVQAAPITGSIDIVAFNSSVVIDKTLNTVTFVDGDIVPGNAFVSNATGSFTPFLASIATYVDFTYSPLAVVNPLWSLVSTLASFDLTAITFINEIGTGLVLNGTGMIHVTGLDSTPGSWSFSADRAAGSALFTFSSQTAAGVPDGGTTVMLLGAALAGLSLVRRELVA